MFSAITNVPNISNKLYQKLHKDVHNFTSETACETMSIAAKEEAKMAMANGDVSSEDGVPIITLIADGSWSKKKMIMLYLELK